MCTDTSSFSADENALLSILNSLYFQNAPNARCHNGKTIASKWPGYPSSSAGLATALSGLASRGCLEGSQQGSFCLTDCGLRAAGVFPPSDNGSC